MDIHFGRWDGRNIYNQFSIMHQNGYNFIVIKCLWGKRILGVDLHWCYCSFLFVFFELTTYIMLLKVICAPLPGYRPWYPYVLYRVSWSLDSIISITVPAGFVLEISWMDVEWQGKLYLITNWYSFDSLCLSSTLH